MTKQYVLLCENENDYFEVTSWIKETGIKDKALFRKSVMDRGKISRGISGGTGDILNEQFKPILRRRLP